MLATDQETEPTRTKGRRVPLEGAALLEFVARLIVERGAEAPDVARKCGLSQDVAASLYAQVFREVYSRIQDTLGADRLRAEKLALKQRLKRRIANCDRAVELSFRDNKPNTRPYTHANAATKLLTMMEGHNAPVQTVNTDIRVYAAVQPKDMDRVLSDPRARAAMLTFEEVVSEINASDPAEVAIDVTPAAEGGDG